MKFQVHVIICITLSLLGIVLSSTIKANENFNGILQQEVESEDYDGMIQQEMESEDYDGMIQQEMESEDYDGMIQQEMESEDYDGMIQQDARFEAKAPATLQWYWLLTTPLYRYHQSAVHDHFYTNNPGEIGTVTPGRVGKYGYKSEGIACRTFKYPFPGRAPLYRYYQAARHDHFYTTNPREIGTTTPGRIGRHGYRSEGKVGYCYRNQRRGTIPLYRYWNPAVSDHFYTTNIREIGTAAPGRKGRYGFISEGVACYVIRA